MMDRQIVFMVLMQFVVSTATGQSCFKRFVGGKMRSYGNCESQSKQQSIVTQVQSSAKKEQRIYCRGDKSLEMTQVSVRLTNGSTIRRSASLNGEWTVIQRRQDGSVNFRRNWIEYVNGFGDPCGEYWLGLDAIYQLTKNGDQQLRIDMIDRGNGNRYWAEYSTFKISDASDKYRLTVSGYSGNATNVLNHQTSRFASNRNRFSTIDADHDALSNTNCATQSGGGWWHNGCSYARLNGNYNIKGWNGILWVRNGGHLQPRFVELKIKKRN